MRFGSRMDEAASGIAADPRSARRVIGVMVRKGKEKNDFRETILSESSSVYTDNTKGERSRDDPFPNTPTSRDRLPAFLPFILLLSALQPKRFLVYNPRGGTNDTTPVNEPRGSHLSHRPERPQRARTSALRKRSAA